MSVEQNGADQEVPAATGDVTETHDEKLSSMIDSMMNPAPAADADQPDSEEAPDQEQPQPAVVEGPTLAMKMLAGNSGVPEKVLALARTDEDVKVLIEQFSVNGKVEEKRPEQPQEPLLPALALELSEDEFPEGDPIRKALQTIQDHATQRDAKLLDLLNGLAGALVETRSLVDQSSQSAASQEIGRFDTFVDGLGIEVLGNRGQQELTPAAQSLRSLIWDRYWDLAGDKPQANPEVLYRAAVEQVGFTTKETTRQKALEQSSKQRLGGGPARAIPDRGPNAESKLDTLLASMGVKQ